MKTRVRAIISSSLAISVALVIGRLLGFARDGLLAAHLGIGPEADVAILLISLPDFVVNVLGAGGLSAVLTVAFARGRADPSPLLGQSMLVVFGVGVGIAGVIVLFATGVQLLLAPGLSAAGDAMFRDWLPVVVAAIPFAAAAVCFQSYLRSRNRFFVPALGAAAINASIVAALVLSGGSATLLYLAWGVAAGGVVRWLIMGAASGRVAVGAFRPGPWTLDRALLVSMVGGLATEAAIFAMPMIGRSIASLLGEGQVAVFGYGIRLGQLPMAVSVMILTTALFPRLASTFDEGQTGGGSVFREHVEEGLIWSLLLATAAAMATIGAADAIVWVVYDWNAISDRDLASIASVLQAFALGLPAMAGAMSLRYALYALGSRGSLVGALFGLGLFLALGLLAVFQIGTAASVGWALSLANWCMFAFFALRLVRLGVPVWRVFLSARLIGAMSVLALVFLAVMMGFGAYRPAQPDHAHIYALAAVAVAALAALVCAVLAVPKYRSVAASLVSRSASGPDS